MAVVGKGGGDAYDGTLNAKTIMVLICSALAVAGGIELQFLIFYSFKRYRGLYFWSLNTASLALIPYSICYALLYFQPDHNLADAIINNIAWVIMVLGQSLVLYSRLHLVLDSPQLLRIILWMIIGTTSLLYIITTAIQFGAYAARSNTDFGTYLEASKVFEKIQMTGFSCQEFILAGLYMRQIIRLQRITLHGNTRRTMWQLFTVNAFIIALDLTMLVMEYAGALVFQQTFKGAAYAIKLKMEFAVLGKLIDMVRTTHRSWPMQDLEHIAPFVAYEQRSPSVGHVSVDARRKSTL